MNRELLLKRFTCGIFSPLNHSLPVIIPAFSPPAIKRGQRLFEYIEASIIASPGGNV
jgi:hypothetical protein